MATRSTIAIRRDDLTMTKIYCHWDGYIEHNGVILQEYYNTPDKVEELLKLGNLSSLGEKINPEGEHSFDHPEEDVCIAYHRDRGEDFYQCDNGQTEEFNYVFDSYRGVWYVSYDEYFENGTELSRELGLDWLCLNREKLLVEAIFECDSKYVSEEDKNLCLEKAKEGRAYCEEHK